MPESGREMEAKFYVGDLERLLSRLKEQNAIVIQSRILEANIRFDLPDARLRSEGQVLRLRRDTEARLTYKGASTREEGVLSRVEIEFTVGDFEKAGQFLKALGYRKLFYYEKYRTTFEFIDTRLMLDELPYGNFVEIEGETLDSIRLSADRLNLKWDRAIPASYHELFERVRRNLNLPDHDLTFAGFSGIRVTPADLGIQPAIDVDR